VPPLPSSLATTLIAPADPLVFEVRTRRFVLPSLITEAVTPASASLMAWLMPASVLLAPVMGTSTAAPPPTEIDSVPVLKVSVLAA
jgi:hypothetical protein